MEPDEIKSFVEICQVESLIFEKLMTESELLKEMTYADVEVLIEAYESINETVQRILKSITSRSSKI